MSEEMKRFEKRRQIETTTINLSTLAALAFSAWILHHYVTLALAGLMQYVP